MSTLRRGFTLIELLVVITIVGILIGLSVFGLAGSRESSRDAKRKADLELIRSGIEIYKSDCNVYPTDAEVVTDTVLEGTGSPASCAVANIYIQKVPGDPDGGDYCYNRVTTVTFDLCAKLESLAAGTLCGCGANYKVTNP